MPLRMIWRPAAPIAVLLTALIVSGCVLTNTLSDGRRTLMGADGVSTRAALAVSAGPVRGPLRYRPVALCEFTLSEVQRPPLRSYSAILAVDLQPIGKQLFLKARVTEGSSTDESSAVIGSDGQLFRFNIMNIQLGRRVTSDTFAKEAKNELNYLGLGNSSDAAFLNLFSLFTPHYQVESLRIGRRAAQVFDESGSVWGYYIYSGVSEFAGRKVMVLDLVRVLDVAPDLGELVVGFTLVDLDNLLPVYSTVDFGLNGGVLRLQRSRC